MRSTAFSSLNLFVSWRRAFSCHSLANCLLSMAWRHSELSSSPLPDDFFGRMNGFGKIWPSLLVTESMKNVPTDGANVEASRP